MDTTSKNQECFDNVGEARWADGSDSDGELGPFLDAVAGQTTRGVEEEEEGFVPASIGGGGGTGEGLGVTGEAQAPDQDEVHEEEDVAVEQGVRRRRGQHGRRRT